ncbi:8-oxo-dGTP diphosphatase MutT [Psychromonas sp. SR45-3]|uniref:8-oxo-dGTP diphosphatase MutT n=1 Tax=Psychromonas sp. SR45-3 TaxID=2760930 RepID=UPI0015F861E8|nr:8-oxo-dGTP diphosphatase MutT [Psychromonas sp. SR45-3]MBB1272923.1 8-oxo-dGTP diphosphatase MutT [Psychromonas sp. SR45-3]
MIEQQTISIAIVQNEQKQLLISRRQQGKHLAGKWEFPGGKVEQGEALETAMLRELKEEVGLSATQFTLFDSLNFQYDQLNLSLHFYLVSDYEGEPVSLEGQQIKWVSVSQLSEYEFPKANLTVINKLL